MHLFHRYTYHTVIILLYLVVCVYALFSAPVPGSWFVIHGHDVMLLLPVVACNVLVFLLLNYCIRFGVVGVHMGNMRRIYLLSVYAIVLIALPEEIIFRGYIQTYLYDYFHNPLLAVILSSVIFGFAHVANGATSVKPSGWNWKLVGVSGVAGLFFGYSFYITGSLILPIVVHAISIILMKLFIQDSA